MITAGAPTVTFIKAYRMVSRAARFYTTSVMGGEGVAPGPLAFLGDSRKRTLYLGALAGVLLIGGSIKAEGTGTADITLATVSSVGTLTVGSGAVVKINSGGSGTNRATIATISRARTSSPARTGIKTRPSVDSAVGS